MTLRWRDFDWLLLGLVLAIGVIGVVQIYSTTVGQAPALAHVYTRQIYFLLGGLVLMAAISQVDYKLWLGASAYLYVAAVLALGLTLTVGRAVFHSRRWVPVAGSRLQVSEFVKLAIIIAVARYCSEARLRLTWADVFRVAGLVGLPALLVLLEPDLGTALTYLPVAAVGLLLGGLRWRQAGVMLLVMALVLPIAWHGLRPYQKSRLEVFLQPSADPVGKGYQLLQSKIAVGAGGLWGQGTAQGSQTRGAFLPVAQTDFIFAGFAEEHGLVGALVLLSLYLLVLMRLIHNAQLAPDRGAGMIVMGVVAVLAFHLMVNVGMVVGMMPVTGIPLPLMSAGGSSLLQTFAGLGMVMNIRMARFVN